MLKVRWKGDTRNESNESIVHSYTLLLSNPFGCKLPSSQSKKGEKLTYGAEAPGIKALHLHRKCGSTWRALFCTLIKRTPRGGRSTFLDALRRTCNAQAQGSFSPCPSMQVAGISHVHQQKLLSLGEQFGDMLVCVSLSEFCIFASLFSLPLFSSYALGRIWIVTVRLWRERKSHLLGCDLQGTEARFSSLQHWALAREKSKAKSEGRRPHPTQGQGIVGRRWAGQIMCWPWCSRLKAQSGEAS